MRKIGKKKNVIMNILMSILPKYFLILSAGYNELRITIWS